MRKAHQFPVLVLLLGVFLFALTGCAPVYVPNTVHTPMLDDRGETQVSGFVGSSGLDVQAALAVSDQIGISADFSYGEQEDQEDDPDFHRHRFGEIGIGYFNEVSRWSQFEVYGGYGRGRAEAYDTYTFLGPQSVHATGRYDRFFVQPALGFKAGPIRLNGAVRVVRVNFYEFETTRTTVSRNEPVFLYEPALGVSLGVDAVRVGVQLGASGPISDPDAIEFDREGFWLSLGAQLRFNVMQ